MDNLTGIQGYASRVRPVAIPLYMEAKRRVIESGLIEEFNKAVGFIDEGYMKYVAGSSPDLFKALELSGFFDFHVARKSIARDKRAARDRMGERVGGLVALGSSVADADFIGRAQSKC